ncbi:MAG: hypothetical protein A3A80_01945 [Candidatus Terrybacteria bacterium RIFCSPLOWO2_01_FULL_44_24]|uniref:Isoleucine--tRNA ligase n=1 Tax=Candidatus Terrybacteria bacterium RIFCSPHIGHO2_01_FULL_43_35 TaxID=1802361 RepID=A0A1G2PE49_9BACT|nr:MAG: hypothetical protein A2828_01735 [Candidatus Terrybacteria bacterium RIFCSPHIGHO2_01_FULL_43_35]OHA50845.1 MAG: hypothetical protein A3A80_01945 [Candidatus Terrybacteria bacterium RIFCSPLOWO2_01_FULL_44_24]
MNFAEQEKEILRYWEDNKIFAKSLKRRARAPRFVFFEGPPTANGQPGIHHVLVRAIKDAFLRYKTMQGFLVERKAGWDTHGLPVEIGVEKELGFKTKQEIEDYGIAEFNAKAKASVWRYKDEWQRLTERIGLWLDLTDPYVTYDNSYIESVWRIIKEIWNKKLLEQDFKVVPYCTRCGTALASHEVAQGYESVTENSVYIKFRIKDKKHTYILSWTTTPWTLPGNVALAVNNDIDYVQAQVGSGEVYILAKDAAARLFKEPLNILAEIKGSRLVGLEYEPLFDIPETKNEKSHKVYAADFVTTEDGTGVVHTAVMYGEDDYNLGSKIGLPKVHTVGEDGRFLNTVNAGLAGLPVKSKEAEIVINSYLHQRNLILKEELYTHDYPFCWRCKTPLLYYARQSWFIRMSALRKQLREANEKVNWVPEHIKRGRFGEWLNEVKDWAISRERYWGIPLPVWKCEQCGQTEVIGSIKELLSRSQTKNKYILVRHAQARANVQGWVSSWPENKRNPLTARGIKQARAAAKRIARIKPDIIFTSPLQRANDTAEIMGKACGIKPKKETELREFDLGAFNSMPIKEYHDFLEHKPGERWHKKPLNGENWFDLRNRMYYFIQNLEKIYNDKTIVLVGHGDPLLLLKGILLGAEDKEYVEPYLKTKKAGTPKLTYPDFAKEEKILSSMPPSDDTGRLDLHRPFVDDLTFACKKCAHPMKRVSEVIDVWFDSGAMPFAQWHYPFENKNRVEKSGNKKALSFPADFICEAVDQTRGWFYTLMAVSVLLGKSTPYKNVVVTGHVVDKNGKKMSKSLGNAISPWDMTDLYGADAVRWYFYTMNHPSDTKRFNEEELKDAQQKFLGTLWNSLSFFKLYAASALKNTKAPASTDILDKWILSRLATASEQIIKRMDNYDITAATRALSAFVIDDLSNWYIRRSRERFQHPKNKKELVQVTEVLSFVLKQTALLAAPFAPFVAEQLWLGLGLKASVHLERMPQINKKTQNSKLEKSMEALRAKIQIALKLRAQSGHKVRQPLSSLVLTAKVANKEKLDKGLFRVLCEEMNVGSVAILSSLPDGQEWLRDTEQGMALNIHITPTLMLLGAMRELVRQIQNTRKDAGLKPKERITLRIWASENFGRDIMERAQEIKEDVYAKRVETGEKRKNETFIIEREFSLGDSKIWIGIRKTK